VAAPITVGYTAETGPEQPTFDPAITVSPSSGLSDGDTITVSGTGYDTATANAHGPGNAGAYVELGWIQSSGWQPSQGFGSDTRANVGAIWVHSNPTPGAENESLLNADGSFQVSLTIDADALAEAQLDGGTLAVFTIAGGGAVSAGSEAFAPITLAGTAPPPGSDSETITATVPEQEGEFSWTISAENHDVTLTDAQNMGAYLESTGELVPVTVTDSRSGGPAWSISGQVGDFSGGLAGKYLGWTPDVQVAGAGATAGAAVQPGLTSGNGLTDASTLASATTGHETGSATIGAALDLQVPVTTPPGTYTATLTLTALS
jgi:hypothetical protein